MADVKFGHLIHALCIRHQDAQGHRGICLVNGRENVPTVDQERLSTQTGKVDLGALDKPPVLNLPDQVVPVTGGNIPVPGKDVVPEPYFGCLRGDDCLIV